ncbi:MAG: glycosyltransferase family 4 protein [Candidatus Omnitrophica bacterium]|nr:glycosyltransferase family 4 protein [Candidatus Omnitrophota bacterium]
MCNSVKKIVRIIARLNIGGPAIHTILLNSGLNKGGYKDVLVSGRISESEGNMMYLARDNNVEPVIIPDLGRDISLIKDIKALFGLYCLIRREKPDIVHTHTAKAGTLGRIAAVLAGVPVRIHTFHGHVFNGYFSPAKAMIFIWIERALSVFTDKIIVVSESVKGEISKKLKIADSGKCVVIPLGLELDKFLDGANVKGRFRKTWGVSSDTLLVGIVGRLVPIKNHSFFLKVAKKIRETAPGLNVRFVVIGDGELKKPLIEMAGKMGLGDIIFTGWIKELPEVYADLDVVALTSLNEGTPVSLIEAMASAKAVISTDVGGVKDIVRPGETGILANNNDIDGFSASLLKLLKNGQEREAIGLRGREFVRVKYSKERLLKDIKSVYEECLSKNRK